MNRRTFLVLPGSLPLFAAIQDSETAIPAELRAGRFFAVPRLRDGRTFACWLDTNGAGFIFDWAVREYGLATQPARMGPRLATLPLFDPAYAVPDLAGGSRALGVFEMSGSDRRDPLLNGFPAQLGASWFAARVWRLNYPAAGLTMLRDGIAADRATADLGFDRVYPQVGVELGGERFVFAFDTAASVAYKPPFSRGVLITATSFLTQALLESLHARFPDWPLERDVAVTGGVDRITVPQVRVGATALRDVAFTTRPGDDVFQGAPTQGKLGANAYGDRIVTIDYPNGRLRIEP